MNVQHDTKHAVILNEVKDPNQVMIIRTTECDQ
jgi:hypothetical protein